jgi:hypothetical protein
MMLACIVSSVNFPRRNGRGASLADLLIALGLLSAVGGLTWGIVDTRLDTRRASFEYQFSQFAASFNRRAAREAARNWNNAAYRPSVLAGTYPLAEGSFASVAVAFDGCVEPGRLVAHNTLPESDTESLAAQMAKLTPAQAIADGNGQTGGVLLNEPIARKLSGEVRLLRYVLSGPEGTRPLVAHTPGNSEQCD